MSSRESVFSPKHGLNLVAMAVLFSAMSIAACAGRSEKTPTDQSCESTEDCPEGSFCDRVELVCKEHVCVPSESSCENGSVVTCNSEGSGFLPSYECPSGVCVEGQCGCASEQDCRPGEECLEDLCVCESEEFCSGRCCPQGEVCTAAEICEDGICEPVYQCRVPCDGEICGAAGDLCCEGDLPVCNAVGECAPRCEGDGQLCGPDFNVCCEPGEYCVFGECRKPGDPCQGFADCDFDEYCDYGINRCMPDDFPDGLECFREIDFDPFQVEDLWHWDGTEVNGVEVSHVANTPAVADMTGSGTPEVAFTAFGDAADGVLVVVDGVDGATLYANDHRNLRILNHVAIGDIDNDGRLEIVVVTNNGIGVVDDIVSCPDPSADPDGCYLWHTTLDGVASNQAPFLADLNGNGRPEVVVLYAVFDGLTGELLGEAPEGHTSMPVVVDLTGDSIPEILMGGCAYHLVDGQTELVALWCNDEIPGRDTISNNFRNYVAVGDVMRGDREGLPEVIWVGDGEVFLLDETGAILDRFVLPGAFRGGPPVVADFDGDGRAEFAVGGQSCYTLFDMDCRGSDDADGPGCIRPSFPACTPGVDCVVEPCSEVENGTGDGILWSIEIVESVTHTGFASAVFDFQGNGRHEVVYGDHCRVFVLDGQTGTPLLTRFASRRANTEMPIVVDVNGDGRSNLLIQANSDMFERDCEEPIANRPDFFPECHDDNPPDYCTEGVRGVFALGDVNDLWVRTRPIWNQHAFFGNNVSDDGKMPALPQQPWKTHNTFRANRQGDVPLNAPDVVVSSAFASAWSCPPDMKIRVTVRNLGMSSISPGLPVTLYDADDNSVLAVEYIPTPILPGGVAVVELSFNVEPSMFNQEINVLIAANDDGSGDPAVFDCNPDTAYYLMESLVCEYFTVE